MSECLKKPLISSVLPFPTLHASAYCVFPPPHLLFPLLSVIIWKRASLRLFPHGASHPESEKRQHCLLVANSGLCRGAGPSARPCLHPPRKGEEDLSLSFWQIKAEGRRTKCEHTWDVCRVARHLLWSSPARVDAAVPNPPLGSPLPSTETLFQGGPTISPLLACY